MSTDILNAEGIFSDRLRLARERKGLRKSHLARKLGFSPQRYQRYEEKRIPDAATLQRLSAVLDVSVDWLLGLENDKKEKFPVREGGREPGLIYPELTRSDENRLIAEHRQQTECAVQLLMVEVERLASMMALAPDPEISVMLRRRLDVCLDKFQVWCNANRQNAVDFTRHDARHVKEKGAETEGGTKP